MISKNQYERIGTRYKGGRWHTYYRDRLTGRTFAVSHA